MKFNFYQLVILCLIISCQKSSEEIIINEDELIENIKTLSSDTYEGRGFTKPGNYKAQQFIAQQFEDIGLEKILETGYIQQFPHTFSGKSRQRMFPIKNPANDFSNVPDTIVYGGNVVGKISGKSVKTIVITGHLDHLGIKNGKIYNGADDDASGTAALFTIARYFKKHQPNHTLIFAAVDAEEVGMMGSSYLVEHLKEEIILNINMDMIAHNDKNELYACGTYHYPELKKPIENIKSPVTLLFGHDNPNDNSKDDWTYSSDHRNFHKKGIPFIYFGVEDHKDYHKPSDTFENINQQFYIDAVKLIIQAVKNFDESL